MSSDLDSVDVDFEVFEGVHLVVGERDDVAMVAQMRSARAADGRFRRTVGTDTLDDDRPAAACRVAHVEMHVHGGLHALLAGPTVDSVPVYLVDETDHGPVGGCLRGDREADSEEDGLHHFHGA